MRSPVLLALVVLAFAGTVHAGPRNTNFGCACQNTFFFADNQTIPAGRSGELRWTVLGQCIGPSDGFPNTYPPSPPLDGMPVPQLMSWCYVQSWSCKATLPDNQYDPVNGMWWDYCATCANSGKGSGSQAGCFRANQQMAQSFWWPTFRSYT